MNKEINNKTKNLICDVLEQMLEEKPLSQISITEIVGKCNISRQTFYRHFDDIYDLIIWLYDNNATGWTVYNKSKDFEYSCISSFTSMKKQPKLYYQIFMNDKDNVFADRFLRSRLELAKQHIGARHLSEQVLFSLELYWVGYIFMMKKWISSGMKESAEYMGKYLYDSLPEILKTYYL